MIFDGGIESAVDSSAFPVAERKNVGVGALDDPKKPPLCKGRWLAAGKTEGLYEGEEHIG